MKKLVIKLAKKALGTKKPVELRPEDLHLVSGGRRLYPTETCR